MNIKLFVHLNWLQLYKLDMSALKRVKPSSTMTSLGNSIVGWLWQSSSQVTKFYREMLYSQFSPSSDQLAVCKTQWRMQCTLTFFPQVAAKTFVIFNYDFQSHPAVSQNQWPAYCCNIMTPLLNVQLPQETLPIVTKWTTCVSNVNDQQWNNNKDTHADYKHQARTSHWNIGRKRFLVVKLEAETGNCL